VRGQLPSTGPRRNQIIRSPAKRGNLNVAVIDRQIRRFGRGGAQVTISTVTFEGHLQVLDTSVMQRSLTFGIGRAKSYGCGLLTLARPAPNETS
ncbi:type I-E CRISPR-associated protein Cas6/Cse3/CasE, partial [Amycolatopsis jiangsuensis]